MKKNILLSMVLVLVFGGGLFGQAGVLDSSFGVGGKVTTELNKSYDNLQSAELQADGKMVFAVYSGKLTGYASLNLMLVRINTNGSNDNSFGTNGKVATGFTIDLSDITFGTGAKLFAIEPVDGKIVVFHNLSENFAIARYTTDGALDTSFGNNGIVAPTFGNNEVTAKSIYIQPDGKIVVVGNSNGYGAVARFNMDGAIDDSFGIGGIVSTNIASSQIEANVAAIQTSGKIVVAGHKFLAGNPRAAVVRLNEDGTLDDTFWDNGTLITQHLGSVNSIISYTNGSIVVSSGYKLLRFNNDGSLNNNFGSNGEVTPPGIGIQSIVRQSGNIIVAIDSSAGGGNSSVFALAKYQSDGSLDNTFGTGGVVTTDFESPNDFIKTILIQPDGKIVAAGLVDQSNFDVALARYEPNGSLDAGFGEDGKLTTNLRTSNEGVNALAIQPDRSVVAAGNCDVGYALARYSSSGNLDNGFGDNGVLAVIDATFYYVFGHIQFATSLGIQADGKIIVGGVSHFPESHGVFSDLVAANGMMTNYLYQAQGDEITRQADGKALVAGFFRSDSGFSEAFLWRLEEGGIPDSSFGTNGKATITEGMALNPIPAITPGNKIMVGIIYGFGNFDVGNVALLRYHENGNLDSTFATNGMLTTDLIEPKINSLIVQPDGKILLAASVVARFNQDGTPDTSFGTDGILSPGFPTHIALQSDGKILATGTENDDFALLRYHEDGTPDDGFGLNGWVVTDFDGAVDKANAIALQPDGKILVAGESDGDFAIARYLSGLETDVFEKHETAIFQIDLFPNPTNDFLNIELPENASPDYLTIYDAHGRLVESQEFMVGQRLSVGHFPKGFYSLKLTDGERVYVGNFIKQ